MKTTHLFLLSALTLACSSAFAQARPQLLPARLLDELRAITGSTGMAAAIVKDGKVVWHGESGYADKSTKKAVSARTEFRLGSVSKFITVAMLARLADQKKIDIDQPVSAYLPAFAGTPYTVAQLTAHTSGMPHYQMPQDAMLDARTTPYRSVTDSLDIFKDRPLAHAPGSKYLYSSFGYNLLSAVIERAAERDFLLLLADTAKLARSPSLQPELMQAPGEHWSKLYDTSGAELPRQNITYKWAGGGMLGNASDLAVFGAATLAPKFISTSTYARFTSPSRLSNGEIVRDGRFSVGTGWRLSTDYAGRPYVHHSGVIQGGRSHLNVYPGDRAAVSLLSNTQVTIAADITGEALYDAYVAPGAAGKCHAGERTYRGRYKNQDIAGTVRYSAEKGLCKAVFSADNHFGQWMAPGRTGVQFVAYGRAGSGPMYYVTAAGIFLGKSASASHVVAVPGEQVELTVL